MSGKQEVPQGEAQGQPNSAALNNYHANISVHGALTSQQLQQLAPGQTLDGTVMGSILHLHNNPNAHLSVVSPAATNYYWYERENQRKSKNDVGFDIKKSIIAGNPDPTKARYIALPLYTGGHWVTTIVDRKTGEPHHHDSKYTPGDLQKRLTAEIMDKNKDIFQMRSGFDTVLPTGQQKDSFNCGVFVVSNLVKMLEQADENMVVGQMTSPVSIDEDRSRYYQQLTQSFHSGTRSPPTTRKDKPPNTPIPKGTPKVRVDSAPVTPETPPKPPNIFEGMTRSAAEEWKRTELETMFDEVYTQKRTHAEYVASETIMNDQFNAMFPQSANIPLDKPKLSNIFQGMSFPDALDLRMKLSTEIIDDALARGRTWEEANQSMAVIDGYFEALFPQTTTTTSAPSQKPKPPVTTTKRTTKPITTASAAERVASASKATARAFHTHLPPKPSISKTKTTKTHHRATTLATLGGGPSSQVMVARILGGAKKGRKTFLVQ